MSTYNRRNFLCTAAAGAVAGCGDFGFLGQLAPVTAAEAKLEPRAVQLRPEIEPLVKLLEETARGRVLEEVADRIRKGTSYREVLAALLLAGVRNVQPRPSVGFKFHAVLVVNSAHLASMSSPDSDRWLPIFWAIDEFKASQSRDVEEGNWTMGAVDESAVPPAHQARDAFLTAMEKWDESAADAAVAGLARHIGAHEILELFAHLGPRDFRSIGHKAIYVANAWRTLQCIGWQHSEPVLRSLTYALLNHEGEGSPATSDLAPDRPWRKNQELARTIRNDWETGRIDAGATRELLATLRNGSERDACEAAAKVLNAGVHPQSVFDALLVGSGELLMRQPGIVGLHAVTSTNALRYLYEASADKETRKMILLQNAAFLPLFHEAMKGRGKVGEQRVDDLQPAAIAGSDEEAIAEIFRDVSSKPEAACQKVLAYLQNKRSPESLITAARRLVFLKGNDSHDYKFSSAVLEDYYHASPEWRDSFLATSVFRLNGSGERDNQLVARIRAAFQA
jgi:hypothetical protein